MYCAIIVESWYTKVLVILEQQIYNKRQYKGKGG